jgi:hypothetical protein
MAAKKIKQIGETGLHNKLHKRHQYNINQIKNILEENNLTVTKADKNKAIVIIHKNELEQKIQTFIQENHITHLSKDPMDTFQKQLQQTLHQCNTLIDKNKHKYLLNIKPKAPQMNARIKTHKETQLIRPVINSTQAPTYKIAKFLNKIIKNHINLPTTFVAKNAQEVATDLDTIQIHNNNKLLTLDIKDLYVNMPTQDILHTTKFWLDKQNNDQTITQQILSILTVIMKQNYFKHNNQFYQPDTGIAMGSPISSLLAEILLQYFEETHMKHHLEHKDIIYYKRYVDDICIIYDQTKTVTRSQTFSTKSTTTWNSKPQQKRIITYNS